MRLALALAGMFFAIANANAEIYRPATTQELVADVMKINATPNTQHVLVLNENHTYDLESGLSFKSSVTIIGNGSTIQGGTSLSTSLIQVAPASSVMMSELTISGGRAVRSSNGNGGGVLNHGTLTMIDCMVLDNVANAAGGGIYSAKNSQLTLEHTTVANNEASWSGGGIYVGGRADLVNVTVSGNKAGNSGGGMQITGNIEIDHVTIARNVAKSGGGVTVVAPSILRGVSFFRSRNSIIAGNSAAVDDVPDLFVVGGRLKGRRGGAFFLSGGHNLIGASPTSKNIRFTETDQVGQPENAIEPRLLPLADRGGKTLTHGLLHNSPAIDAGEGKLADSIVRRDQRGKERVGAPDVGSYEYRPARPVRCRIKGKGRVCVRPN